MELLTVTDIIEEDFGCEGRPPGQEPRVTVAAVNSAGEERRFTIDDRLAYELGLDVGTRMAADGDGLPVPRTEDG